jgi:hypothetical protein
MIDLTTETPVSLTAVTRLVPPGPRRKSKKDKKSKTPSQPQRTCLSTVLRWVLRGSRAPDGSLVRLEAVRLGGKWVTSREALQRFAEKLTPTFDNKPAEPPRSPTARARASARAARELERVGI